MSALYFFPERLKLQFPSKAGCNPFALSSFSIIKPLPPLMKTSKLISHLRRSRPLYSLYALSQARHSHLSTNSTQLSSPLPPSPRPFHYGKPLLSPPRSSLVSLYLLHSRSYSSPSAVDREFDTDSAATELVTESEVINWGFSEVTEGMVNTSGSEELALPVRAVISMLDGYHDLTALPWWIVIASSTLALRVFLFPLLIFQLHKLKRISELFPKLPSPLPPPLSGRSYVDQISLFRKERKAIGCPSYLWFLAYFSIQVPCFLLWMTSIRRMSLDHHPGFDCGGTLWFQNLTEFSHGVSGPIFPLLIAGLHYINVQISFKTTSVQKMAGTVDSLAKLYKSYLDLLTLPLFFIGYCIPQGSQIYWVTNSSISVIQHLSMRHPALRAKLGLPDKDAPTVTANSKEMGTTLHTFLDSSTKQRKISVQDLSPKELLALSVQLLSKEQRESAIPLLRLALDKDPEYVRALIVMGQTLLQKGRPAEATEYLERAISKLCLAGHPSDPEHVDLLILASQWAGVACIRQGKAAEGIVHLERVANLKEPEEAGSKAHYFDGLVLYSSVLFNEGRKAEATKYLRLAAAYNPAYNEYLEQCEKDEDQ